LNLVVVNNTILFFNIRDGPYFPTLRVLHQCALVHRRLAPCSLSRGPAAPDPEMMPRLRVDKGAIRFVFAGANIMCPGLTSAGATLHDEVDEDTPVVRMQLPRRSIAAAAEYAPAPRRPSTRRARRRRWPSG
jgi:predicted ribosome-associated RNA-binding protein Tma20